MKPLSRITLIFTLAGLLLLTLAATVTLAAPEKKPSTLQPASPTSQTVNLPASQDNTLYEDPSGLLSNGAGQYFFAGKTSSTNLIRRGLIAFDIASNIPSGSTILSATLILSMSKSISGAEPVSLHSVLSDWGEGASDAGGEEGMGIAAEPGDATWLHTFYTSTLWTTAGGDFNPSASATTSVDGVGSYSWSSPQMVTDIQVWLDSPASDNGWLLQGNEAASATAKRFDTRENPTPANRPVLMVTYELPLPIINELDADQAGTDAAEFIELYDGGTGNTPLDGMVLVLYNGSTDVSYQAFDLDGQSTSATGYFVLCGNAANVPNCDMDVTPDTNLIQNGEDAAALYMDDATSFPNGTAVTTTNLIDAIVYDTNDPDDPELLALLNPSQPQVNEGAANSTVDSNQRCANGSGGYRNTDTYIQVLPSPGETNNCPVAAVAISKSAPIVVGPGELYTYTLSVENTLGITLTGVSIADIVPANATFAYVLDGGNTVVSGTDTIVGWVVPSLVDQATIDVRFAVTATSLFTDIINANYGVQAANYLTLTVGSPITTEVTGPLRIHDIQGEGHTSTYNNAAVLDVPGIVTVVRSSSFYMQDPNPDSSDSTSEGITVFVGGAPTVNVGDFVLVSGQVDEFYPGGVGSGNLATTQLSNPTVVISSTGNTLPAATIIGVNGRIPPNSIIDDDSFTVFDPDNDGIDFYESLEGMLVQIENGLVVGSKRFGEIQIVVDNGANATGLSPRGTIVINANDFNPERIIIDDTIVSDEPFAEVGYTFTDIVTGVMDYSFGNFKVFNSEPLPALTPGGLISETSALTATADHLTVASFNVLNLDPGDSTFAGLADTIINNLNAPDIIGLEEIQDNNGATNDGTTDASQTYGALITAITNAGGPTYEFRDIAPADNMDGGQPGGNIRVGFLFQPARVTFVDRPGGDATTATSPQLGTNGVELTFSPGRINPTDTAFDDSRKPLAGEFLFNDLTIFVVANHFNSKGGDDPLFGANQPPVLSSEVQRLQQAQVVHDFVASIQALDANANVIVLGDLNDFQFSPPLATLQNGVLTNLMDMLPADEQYTYIFDGNAQVLDHILASDYLATVAEVDVVHVNAEFDEGQRASDHDPVLARFDLPLVAPTAVTLTGPSTGTTDTAYTFDASVLPLFTTLPITFTWAADGQAASSQPLFSLTDSISYSWATTGTKVISVTAANRLGSVSAIHTIVITAPIDPPSSSFDIYLPFITKAGGTVAANATETTASQSGPGLALASFGLLPMLLAFGWWPSRYLANRQ